jgi:two-component system sensor histidine kinase KdpD
VEGRRRPAPARAPAGRERILICLTGSPSSAILIRRGKRVADYLQADCIALHVSGPSKRDSQSVERHMSFARSLRIDTHVVESHDIAAAVAAFARERRITQIFLGRSAPRPFWKRLHESVVQQVVRLARDKQITIVAQRG